MQRWVAVVIVVISVSFMSAVSADEQPFVEFLNSGKVLPKDLPEFKNSTKGCSSAETADIKDTLITTMTTATQRCIS